MPLMSSHIPRHLDEVRERIAAIAASAGRDASSVRLLAVSKTFPASDVRAAFDAGQRAFGENYVQESVAKIAELGDLRSEIEWHFIGPLQSNKTKVVAENFDWVHSIDRLKIAERLSDQRAEDAAPLNVCLQVNVSGEASKSGVPPDEALALARAIVALPRLTLRGLMAIPEPAATLDEQRVPHRRLRELFDALNADGLALDTLSIGMSADLEAAVLEGSTMVRIGTAIFGSRTYSN
jgi:pyridoxal phosphate enzyme (YggS family)